MLRLREALKALPLRIYSDRENYETIFGPGTWEAHSNWADTRAERFFFWLGAEAEHV